jgi:DNA-binding MarR family transcriptional regulator
MGQETLETADGMRRSLARLNRCLRLESRVPGLSATKHSILGQLYRGGPKTPKALAAAEGVQPQSVTRVLAELEESGWVLRAQDELDRRQFKLEITSEGRQLIIQDAKNRASWLASAMDARLTVLEKDLLRLSIQLLDKLGEAPLSDQRDGTAT